MRVRPCLSVSTNETAQISSRISTGGGDILKKMTSDLELLQNYARNKSEESFTALVNRHVNLVYSAGLPQVRSPQLGKWKRAQGPHAP